MNPRSVGTGDLLAFRFCTQHCWKQLAYLFSSNVLLACRIFCRTVFGFENIRHATDKLLAACRSARCDGPPVSEVLGNNRLQLWNSGWRNILLVSSSLFWITASSSIGSETEKIHSSNSSNRLFTSLQESFYIFMWKLTLHILQNVFRNQHFAESDLQVNFVSEVTSCVIFLAFFSKIIIQPVECFRNSIPLNFLL